MTHFSISVIDQLLGGRVGARHRVPFTCVEGPTKNTVERSNPCQGSGTSETHMEPEFTTPVL